MVKIIRKSVEEKEEEVNHRNLVEIAQEMFGEERVRDNLGIYIRDAPKDINIAISISPCFYQVSVHRADYFERAKELAQKYESRINKEFTLRLEY